MSAQSTRTARLLGATAFIAAVTGSLAGGETKRDDSRPHWAFQPVVRPAVPTAGATARAHNAVDAFLARERERLGLEPLLPAEPRVLLRRLCLDLTGLAPGRKELQAFLADSADDAHEREVDRLLASPRFGERWGRHWMDVWRYSDWYGRRAVPDVLNSYGQVWRWRDWIVRAVNEDKGYDRRILEMLAADEIAPGDDESAVATGFIVRNFYRWNYNSWMKDAVEHTAKAFLGITLECAHCHDHKYDPIAQEEYFKFRAFFEPIEIRHDRVPGEPDPGPYPKYAYGASYGPMTSGLVRVMDEKLEAQTFFYTGGESRNVVPGRAPVPPGVPAALGGDPLEVRSIELPPEAWYPGLRPFVREEEIARRRAAVSSAEAEAAKARGAPTVSGTGGPPDAVRAAEEALAAARAELASLEARIAADLARHVRRSPEADGLARAASRAEREAALAAARVRLGKAERTLAAAEGKPEADAKRATEIEAAAKELGAAKAASATATAALEKVSAEYSPLGPVYPARSTGRRAALARWIASPRNPLTARVAVNHVWARHFGRPLVATPSNFGRNGAPPVNPELLDWLAAELMDSGWSLKHIHRLIVSSAAYRRRSSAGGLPHHGAQVDPGNRAHWRFEARRLEAECVRDGTLNAAGELDLAMGGREIDAALGLTSRRRSLYFAHHGEARMELLELFDAANPLDCYERAASVRPQQALALLNGGLAVAQGRLLARSLWAEAGAAAADPTAREAAFIAALFEQVLGRPASPAESEAASAFLREQASLLAAATAAELAATKKDEAVPPSTDPGGRARESLAQALFSHDDFISMR